MRLLQLNSLFPRRVTGRMVLAAVVAFFAVIIAVNLTMATLAITTFGGIETRNAYQAGLSFSREIASARRQAARDWRVEARISSWVPEGVIIDVTPRDASGLSIGSVDVTVTFAHPANRRRDHVVQLTQIGAGAFRGQTGISPGQWDVVVEVAKDGERLFRSRTRMQIR